MDAQGDTGWNSLSGREEVDAMVSSIMMSDLSRAVELKADQAQAREIRAEEREAFQAQRARQFRDRTTAPSPSLPTTSPNMPTTTNHLNTSTTTTGLEGGGGGEEEGRKTEHSAADPTQGETVTDAQFDSEGEEGEW